MDRDGSGPGSPGLARLGRIVSGGQTGADRAALDFAIHRGIPYGGWCPAGGWAEDQPDPPGLLATYPMLRATESADPGERTVRNVRDGDATLVVVLAGAVSPGTERTCDTALRFGRPLLVVDARAADAARRVEELLAQLDDAAVLNVGGPRESECPGLYAATWALLQEVAARSPDAPGSRS